MLTMLACQKDQFQLEENRTYLNCAYMSPLLKRVEKVGIEGLLLKRRPYEISSEDFFTTGLKVREAFSNLIHANSPANICTIPSVSYGMAVVAQNVPLSKGDKIIIVGEQFPSNYYVWERKAMEAGAQIEIISAPDVKEKRGKIWNERILSAINKGVKVVSMAHVHWADGTKFDLEKIRERTHDIGAYLTIDGTQSVGALPFDISKIQVDALVCGAYKWLLGPYSIGVAYFGDRLLNGVPIEESWMNRLGSEDFASLVNYTTEYQPGARRYEVGEASNFVLLPMLLESLTALNEWKPENIQSYCTSLIKKPVYQLKEMGFDIEDEAFRGAHLWGIRLPETIDAKALKLKLDEQKVYVSVRGNAVRVSPHLYNTPNDLNQLTSCLSTLLS